MAISLSVVSGHGGAQPLQPPALPPVKQVETDASATALSLRLRMPLRPAVPLSDYAGMTALERTEWEIKTRSQTALYVQTMALHGDDVAALLA